jgi:GNAT superfamily N-acetyltransferase
VSHIPLALTFRVATDADCALLGELNRQLIRDEGHRNSMSAAELAERMRGWLAAGYVAHLFALHGDTVAYALSVERGEEIYLRQLFVTRGRRRQGIGRRVVEILRTQVWPPTKRLTVDVLVRNEAAVAFWRAVGYRDYALTLEILPERRP